MNHRQMIESKFGARVVRAFEQTYSHMAYAKELVPDPGPFSFPVARRVVIGLRGGHRWAGVARAWPTLAAKLENWLDKQRPRETP